MKEMSKTSLIEEKDEWGRREKEILKRYNELRVSEQMYDYMCTKPNAYINNLHDLFIKIFDEDVRYFRYHLEKDGASIHGVEENYKIVTDTEMPDTPCEDATQIESDLFILRDSYRYNKKILEKVHEELWELQNLLGEAEYLFSSKIETYTQKREDILKEMDTLKREYHSLTGRSDIVSVLDDSDEYTDAYESACSAIFAVDNYTNYNPIAILGECYWSDELFIRRGAFKSKL